MAISTTTSIILTAVVAFGSISAAQAPRCAGIFTSAPAISPKIEEIIHRLAEMKLNLDIAMSKGDQSAQSRNLKNIYTAKVQELRDHLGSQVSDHQIRELIINKIKFLQNRNNELLADENQGRNAMAEAIRTQPTVLDVDYLGGVRGSLTYLKEIDSIVSLRSDGPGEGVAILDLKTERNRVVKFDSRSTRIFDNGMVFFVDLSGNFKSYDIINDKFAEMGSLRHAQKSNTKVSISPSAEWISIRTKDEVYFENMKTGQDGSTFKNPLRKKWFHAFSGNSYSSNKISGTLYLNDSEIIIFAQSWHTRKEEHYLYHFNFKTGLITEIDTAGFNLANLTPHAGAQTLYFTDNGRIGEIKYSELGNFKSNVKFHDLNSGAINRLELTPNDNTFYIVTTNFRTGQTQEFYAPIHNLPSNQDHVTKLAEYLMPASVYGAPAFDMENRRMFVSRKSYDELNPNIHTFKLEIRGLPYVH